MNSFKKKILFIALAVCSLALASCGGRRDKHDPDDIEIKRFEQFLFETPAQNLQKALVANKDQFDCRLLNIWPDEPEYMEMLQGYLNDPYVQAIYRSTDSLYHNLYWLEHELTPALKKAHHICPELHCTNIYTMVTSQFDYQNRVFCDDSSMVIAIDQYALKHFPQYSYFGSPMFIVDLSDSAYLAVDCMACLAKSRIAIPTDYMTMLDYMVAEGKALYFVDQVLPNEPEYIKMRYTPEQLKWVKGNEDMIWSYFLQNKLLYENNYARYHNFVDEAPKTNAFQESAPRTTAYIGWQIIKKYVKKTGCSVSELFAETDSQKILKASGYKPAKH